MSKEYPTVNETIAYEDGFADAKDYWVAKERERIIKLLDTDFWHHRVWGYEKITCHPDCLMCETLALIKGEK